MSLQSWQLPAVTLASRIAAKEISSAEVVADHLARIDAVNPAVNAVTATLADEATAAARAADHKILIGEPIGPLHGVPVTVKENLDVAGCPTTSGVAAFRDLVASADAQAVARLRAAGAIPIARTNLPEFAIRAHTDNDLYGATTNPWDPSVTPGGSSGGEAVALATGMSPLGLGNDLAGSVRMPAQCNGVCGLKPSRGRVPWWNATDPGPPLFVQLMAVCGPMARRVEDLAVALHAISGADPSDPWSVPLDPRPARDDQAGPTAVAVVMDPEGGATDPEVRAGVGRAADALADAGYRVDEVPAPPIATAFEVWSQLVWSQLDVVWPLMAPLMSPGGRSFVEGCLRRWPPLDRDGLAGAWIERARHAREWSEFHSHHPLLLGPAFTSQPFDVGHDESDADAAAQTMRGHRLLTVANLVGLPSLAVPVGAAGGLPQAVQLIGPYSQDELCLAAGQVIETRFDTLTPLDPTPTNHSTR